MTSVKIAGIVFGALLNLMDIVVSFFLIWGGLNATNNSPMIGYATATAGVGLLYLSTGTWTGGKWKIITRLAAYIIASIILLIILVVLVLVDHETVSAQTPIPLILFLLMINDILSIAYLRVGKLGFGGWPTH